MERINISTKNEKLLNEIKGNSYFDAVISKEDDIYCSLCIELNVATEGETIEEAKKNLLDAVKDYIELSLELSKVKEFSIIRLVPIEDNPLLNNDKTIVEKFKIEVNTDLFEYA